MIPVSEPNLCGNEAKYVMDAVNSTWISSIGAYLDRFEKMFRDYLGCRHAIAVCNGTAALHLALAAVGIKPGDEVIVPNVTFIATANAVVYCGAIPVFADIDPDTWNISLASVERLITERTRAIIPVHLYGHAVDLDAFRPICAQYDLVMVEDAAEAIGTEYRGKKVGALTDIGIFSLYGNKTITTGEGGVVVTNDDALADRARNLKDHAMSKTTRYWFDHVGYNYRMTNLQAAIGCAQMENLDDFVEKKRENAKLYNEYLSGRFGKPVDLSYGKNSYWMYSAILPAGYDRETFFAHMKARGVDTRPFFYPLSMLPPYRSYRAELSTETSSLASRGFNLPSSTILTPDQIKFVANAANEFVGR